MGSGKEPNWEFNCPQYFDFTSNAHVDGNDGADQWFDRGTDVAIPSIQTVEAKRPSARTQNSKSDILSPIPSPRVGLFSRPVNETDSPLVKRLRLSDASMVSKQMSTEQKRRRRPSIAKSLLINARKTIRNRFLLNQKKCGSLSWLNINRKPMAIFNQNIEPREPQPQDDDSKPVDFIASLRRYNAPVSSTGVLKSTMPVPFKLSHAQGRPSRSPFRSIAEQVMAFERQTPSRFRSLKKTPSSAASSASGVSVKRACRRVGTPRLLCKERNRPIHVLSQLEKEALEIDEMKKSTFHAKPVNPAILQEKSKLPEVEKRPATTIEPFNIAARRPRDFVEIKEEFKYVARPIPKSLFDSPKFKPVLRAQLTEARSPAFSLTTRLLQHQLLEVKRPEEMDIQERSRRPNITAQPFVPSLEHKATAVEPFTFEERDKDKKKLKEEKIREIFEEERRLREFHAKPIPISTKCITGVPQKVVSSATTVKPFELLADKRGAQKKWHEEVNQRIFNQKKQVGFKARPCTVTTADPFIPEKDNRPLTSFRDFDLHTEKRAKEREAFEADLRTKKAEMDEAKRIRDAVKAEEERLLLAELRANIVHHAQPIHHYKEVQIQPSARSPTDPRSPDFATNKRKRSS